MTDAINVTALRTLLDAMHEHANLRDAHTERIAGLVRDGKAKGFDGKALRKVFVRERMDADKRQRDDDLLDLYEGALGAKGKALKAVRAGATMEQAAHAYGIGRATVARAKAVSKQGRNDTPHDPATGEVIKPGGALVAAESERPAPAPIAFSQLSAGSGPPATQANGEGEGAVAPIVAEADAARPTQTPVLAVPAASGERDGAFRGGSQPAAAGNTDDDWDAINKTWPPELRRVAA